MKDITVASAQPTYAPSTHARTPSTLPIRSPNTTPTIKPATTPQASYRSGFQLHWRCHIARHWLYSLAASRRLPSWLATLSLVD
jgi:hypothetical protein